MAASSSKILPGKGSLGVATVNGYQAFQFEASEGGSSGERVTFTLYKAVGESKGSKYGRLSLAVFETFVHAVSVDILRDSNKVEGAFDVIADCTTRGNQRQSKGRDAEGR